MKNNRQWIAAKEELKQHISNAQKDPKSASESIVSEYAFDLAVSKTPNIEQQMSFIIKDLRDELRTLRNDVYHQNVERISIAEGRHQTFLVTIEAGSGTGVSKDKSGRLLSPDLLMIRRGDTVTWMNNDKVGHTVTSGKPSDTQTGTIFDSSLIKAGGVYSFTFTGSGDCPYFDMIHPWIIGMIMVR